MEYITDFTPYREIIGGLLIGLSVLIYFLFLGRIAGISGMVHGLCPPTKGSFWRLAFILGLITGGFGFYLFPVIQFPPREGFPIPLLMLAGFLVGIGTRLGNGCTSGHGICGIARFSVRSIVATILFMLSAMVSVYVVRHIFGVY